ncbi:MAG: STAS domain-containing protein [Bacteroidales bacterium]|nr:STAS domain-containing protein [Bacteroidales bacterium]
MDNKELQKTVNPVYLTAKGTLGFLYRAKDPDAVALWPLIGLETNLQERAKLIPPSISNCYRIAQQARYEINNTAALRSSAPNIVDLPSGYSPRGFRVSSAGKRYFGFDLPVVIDDMAPAAEKVMTPQQRSLSSYHAVDATNYQSMKEALGDVKGELCIVTEGLLGYFNESELVSLCQAIHRLLSEYGGTWMTADLSILRIYALTFGTLLKGEELSFMNSMKEKGGGLADVKMNQNSLFLNGEEGALRFLEEQGFTVVAEPVTLYLPDVPDVNDELRNAYRQMNMLTMRVASPKTGKNPNTELPFAVDSSVTEGKLLMKVQGRVDTLTATQLLKAFQDASPQADSIELDVEKMPYISSAGLRVLLIMRKSVKDKSCFKLFHIQPEVEKILKMTGFDTLLL